ncbi:cardiotrophin-like cytokine factor 1 isoform X1 [Lepus europaeus]|uniref:cardiotrophin-like cytokine factor 1 isoform X1 n=1 Tax=Lepus europaeus TaxID=9983 RepID=UPI002B486E73|nr:cardiotrophin-like cytokine factor 1 isoform X1 [Lepus europaeus]
MDGDSRKPTTSPFRGGRVPVLRSQVPLLGSRRHGVEAVIPEGRALSTDRPSAGSPGIPEPPLSLALPGQSSNPPALSSAPPPPACYDTVTSELKYSWKHRPRLVNFMSRFSAQMTSLVFIQRLLPLLSCCREPVLPRDALQRPAWEGAGNTGGWDPGHSPHWRTDSPATGWVQRRAQLPTPALAGTLRGATDFEQGQTRSCKRPPGQKGSCRSPKPAHGYPEGPRGDSWGMLACLCTVLWHLPAVPALNRTGDPGPGPSIQKTYDLTRYLEHQLRSLAGTYLNYLGPPFNEPDFNPPRLGAETLPRATVNLEVWRSLNDKLRLTQNYEAYSHLLCYLRGLNRQAATAELRRSLAHFCTSLQGLLGSIAGVMAALGYPLPQPLPGTEPAWAPGPAHSDFLQKMDDFWLLKELQTWLWRSAKDFNRLKKKVQPPAAAVTLHLEAHGF